MVDKEKIRRELIERYLSTGKVGMRSPKSDEEAVDLIETVVEMYEEEPPKTLSLSEMSAKFKNLLDFWYVLIWRRRDLQ